MDPIDHKLNRFGLNNSTTFMSNLVSSTTEQPDYNDTAGELSRSGYLPSN